MICLYCIYCEKLDSGLGGICTIIVIFTRAACEQFDANGCVPLAKKVVTPLSYVDDGISEEYFAPSFRVVMA
jgi:hypothetical protein